MVIRVSKNTLFRLALKEAGMNDALEKLNDYLSGSNAFIFTNINPFQLFMILEKYKMPVPAKPGDIADKEIVVPAGNTGITPGPILSTFGKLKIPTKVQDGTIWVTRDVVVAKPGDKISPELASLLQKLGIEPMEVGIKIKVVYEDGLIYTPEVLKLDIKQYEDMFKEAHLNAVKLGIALALPIPEVISYVITKAHVEALNLAVNANYVSPETLPYIVAKASAEAQSLAAIISSKAPDLGLQVQAPVEQVPEEKEEVKKEEEKVEEEEEEKKEVSEEEIAEGLGALFG